MTRRKQQGSSSPTTTTSPLTRLLGSIKNQEGFVCDFRDLCKALRWHLANAENVLHHPTMREHQKTIQVPSQTNGNGKGRKRTKRITLLTEEGVKWMLLRAPIRFSTYSAIRSVYGDHFFL
jgi:hypothetical protein